MLLNLFTRKQSSTTEEQIIQYSPTRSGSTVAWQILTQIFPKKNIYKTHRIDIPERNLDLTKFTDKILITYRNPIDAAISRFRIGISKKDFQNKSYSWEQLEARTRETKEILNRLQTYVEFFNYRLPKNTILLRYEDFESNLDVIFDSIETHWGTHVSKDRRNKIKKRVSKKKNLKISKRLKRFGRYDKKTHIHGDHIYITDNLQEEIPPGYLTKLQSLLTEEIQFYKKLSHKIKTP